MKSLGVRLLFSSLLFLSVPVHGQVIISEFMADNKHTLADEDNSFPDWIELYNSGANTVNLKGWALTDDPSHQAKWVFPSTNLLAKGLLVVFASGKNRTLPGTPLHTDFSLKASGEYLALLKPDSSVATEFAPTFPPQSPDISFGLAQNVTTNAILAEGAWGRYLVPLDGQLGSTWTQPGFDDSNWARGATGIGYQTSAPGFAVHNYLASIATCNFADAQGVINNPAQQAAVFAENAPVLNYLNTDSSANYGNDRTFPGLTLGVDHDNFVVHATATVSIPAAGDWTFGVNSDDGFLLSVGGFNVSYPAPRGPGDTLQTFHFEAEGDYPLDLIFYECGGGAELELYAAQGALSFWDPTNFRLVGDVANGGLSVYSPIVTDGDGSGGYGPLIATDLEAQMAGVNSSVFQRIPFIVTDPTALQSLILRMKYDDGFVAYLNGQVVATRNAPATPQWNSRATSSHPNTQAVTFEDINLSGNLSALRAGENVLAIQGLNQSVADNDFLILPALVDYQTSALTNQYFGTPTPGSLNNSGFVAFVSDTKFSVDRGFFTVPFTLSITSATPGATIVYTTDGSTPSPNNGSIYSGPLSIRQTTVIRAAAFKNGFHPSDVDTQSYIFPADILRQSPNGETPAGWPASWGANVVDYGMDPQVVNNPAYSSELTNDLRSIPSYSITTDPGNLFDPLTGIYANPSGDGLTWERPASIELINPDATKGFHINGGIRIRGGYSRSPANPKHAFRLFFRQQYGSAKLQFPAFAGQQGADSFDGFDLRTFENYSWSFEGDYRFIGLRDQWSRDTQWALGQPAERGDFYHLYLNGQYWGLFNTDERPEASYGETNVVLAAGGLALLVPGDPALFRARHSVAPAVPIFGPYPGRLQGGGETLSLQRPDPPDLDLNTGLPIIPFIDVDVVRYDDRAPWPTAADGLGASLERLNAFSYGNDPINWRASPSGPSPGLENTANRAPIVDAGPDQLVVATNAPVAVPLAGVVSDDGAPSPPGKLTVSWSEVGGPGQVWFASASQAGATAFFPGIGTYVLRLTASDGALQSVDDVTVTIQHAAANTATTLVAANSVWKFLDDGSDQGTAWVAPDFKDDSWGAGPAPLGYGDANGQLPATTIGFGSDVNNKFITTYFRRQFAINSAAAITNVVVGVQRDDGVLVYLNGAPIFTNNMPAPPVNYLSLAPVAVGGGDETAVYSQPVDASLLVDGINVIAAEVHQANASSSDVIFDLSLTGESFAPNSGPSVDGGPDRALTLPASLPLKGAVQDDGLPIPPGQLTFGWSKLSGPGAVTFSNPSGLNTSAAFSSAGSYVLRLAATDGAASAFDDVLVSVAPPSAPAPRIDSVALRPGSPTCLSLRFTAVAGQTYTLQFANALTDRTWLNLTNISAPNATQMIEMTDPVAAANAQRFYRIVTPAQP